MIAKETNIAIDIVKRSIQNLLWVSKDVHSNLTINRNDPSRSSYADVIMLIPVIQFSSMFVKTPKIAEFYSNHELHAECIKFVMLDPGTNADNERPQNLLQSHFGLSLEQMRSPRRSTTSSTSWTSSTMASLYRTSSRWTIQSKRTLILSTTTSQDVSIPLFLERSESCFI